jgi:DNA-directed RNA polymerase I subunit RPA1
MADTDVIIRQGHLLSGLIDKAHCGATLASVVHCYYELYGKRCAADLVSAFSKLFTLFLQYYRGFTLGIEGTIFLLDSIYQYKECFRCSFTFSWFIPSTSFNK